MITLLLFALLQDTPEDVLKALSDPSAVARAEAADKLQARGRSAIPLLREAEAKADGDGLVEVRKVIARIGEAEVIALLKSAGHDDVSDLKVYTDDVLSKRMPHGAVYLVPGQPGCKACGNVERMAVVNTLADVAKLFPGPAKDLDDRRAVAAAAMFILRAMHPKAHTREVIPRDDEAFADPTLITWNDLRGTCGFKIGHAYYEAILDFTDAGALGTMTLKDTGRRCR